MGRSMEEKRIEPWECLPFRAFSHVARLLGSSMASLPVELYGVIIEHIQDRESLLSLLLLTPTSKAVVERTLYHTPKFTSDEQQRRFLRHISTCERVASLVVHLQITRPLHPSSSWSSDVSWDLLLSALQSSTSLTDLGIYERPRGRWTPSNPLVTPGFLPNLTRLTCGSELASLLLPGRSVSHFHYLIDQDLRKIPTRLGADIGLALRQMNVVRLSLHPDCLHFVVHPVLDFTPYLDACRYIEVSYVSYEVGSAFLYAIVTLTILSSSKSSFTPYFSSPRLRRYV